MFILLPDRIGGSSILLVVFVVVELVAVKVDDVAFVFIIEFDSVLFNLDEDKLLLLFTFIVVVDEEDGPSKMGLFELLIERLGWFVKFEYKFKLAGWLFCLIKFVVL